LGKDREKGKGPQECATLERSVPVLDRASSDAILLMGPFLAAILKKVEGGEGMSLGDSSMNENGQTMPTVAHEGELSR